MFSAKELSTNERDLTTIQSARYRSAGSRYDCHCHTVSPVCMWRLKQAIFPRRSLKQRCPWIGFIHGLDWIGLDWVRWLLCTKFWRPMFSGKQTGTVLC